MSEHKPSRWLYLLTAAVLLLGTVLVVVGTRGSQDDGAGANHGREDSRLSEMSSPVSLTPALLERAATLQRMECAGCHSNDRREIGPSYAVIAGRYRSRAVELSAAVGHPKPGWADYPPGPSGPPLTQDDRAALAAWIMNQEGKGDE
jgi:cytochrome c551/c552